LTQEVIDELTKLNNGTEADIDKVYKNLTILSRYGSVLMNNGKITEKYSTLYQQLLTLLKDTSILLSECGVKKGDTLVIKIINYEREFKIKLIIKEFGWNGDVTDSYLYVQRKGSQEFTPMQGVTLYQLFTPRKYSADWADKWLFFAPGFGINVSFPQDKVNNSTQLSAGLAFSLFNNAVFLTCGADLTTKERLQYYGIGFSFTNIAGKILNPDKK
jgi:hypothetical protein